MKLFGLRSGRWLEDAWIVGWCSTFKSKFFQAEHFWCKSYRLGSLALYIVLLPSSADPRLQLGWVAKLSTALASYSQAISYASYVKTATYISRCSVLALFNWLQPGISINLIKDISQQKIKKPCQPSVHLLQSALVAECMCYKVQEISENSI